MFHEARIKLTLYYLSIIMLISLAFSTAIYIGINGELKRIEAFQKGRIQRIIIGIPDTFEIPNQDFDIIAETRRRILSVLGFINFSILLVAGGSGYYLAGKTLDPIQKNMDEQKSFVSNASHQLRTPLTSLRSEIEVYLRDKKLTLKDAKGLLRSNLEEVEKMQKMSDYLLKLNKYGDNEKIPFSKIDLKKIAEIGLARTTKTAESKNIKIISNLRNSFVTGNEEALSEVATILLDNAIKYTLNGKNIFVETGNKRLVIKDEGVGIPKKDIDHIFERFYRSDKSKVKDGYGLGLSIAKSVVDLHGGEIKVESRLEKGTTFKVILS